MIASKLLLFLSHAVLKLHTGLHNPVMSIFNMTFLLIVSSADSPAPSKLVGTRVFIWQNLKSASVNVTCLELCSQCLSQKGVWVLFGHPNSQKSPLRTITSLEDSIL